MAALFDFVKLVLDIDVGIIPDMNSVYDLLALLPESSIGKIINEIDQSSGLFAI